MCEASALVLRVCAGNHNNILDEITNHSKTYLHHNRVCHGRPGLLTHENKNCEIQIPTSSSLQPSHHSGIVQVLRDLPSKKTSSTHLHHTVVTSMSGCLPL